ncbi:uncharacterized protein LOC113507792 isoform X2 [Trichoplusia ni]|uniref:phospholipase A2 n=1 Tax=Trichoplusia ni TaxID=7111 RepID=A0A7E5X2A3_TRINI|nr:uncharacterized protein LOC113507792 isoform X2 [Trichoplusia ni]
MLNSIFRGLLGTEEAPTKVLEVRSDNYISRPIHYREDSILLYGPKNPPDSKNSKDKYYEIVLHKPFTESLHQMYSLYRAKSIEDAEEKFIVFKERIPTFIQITKECTVAILQKLCNTLLEHQSWTIAHLAAHFGLNELFNSPEVQKHIDDIDSQTGATPLMVAVKSCHVRLVQSLVSLNCSLDTIDLEGNTVYHYAAASNKEIINALATKSPSSLNVYNKQGYTPLHTACLADAPDCVRALMLAGADVNLSAAKRTTSAHQGIVGDLLQDNQPKLYQQDMKHGGTPIHWAISREVIEALVDKNCDINALNFDGRTALHIMVLRGRLECAIALLSRGAEHSIGDNEGNTPLHLAVKQTNLSIVQALIVFGADLEAKNNMGNTPRHVLRTEMSNSSYDRILYILHAVGAKRCPAEVSGCGASCSARGDYNGVPPAAVARACTRDLVNHMLAVAAMDRAACLDTDHKQGRLLCLDGGGIRGLVLVQVLINLEEAVGRPIVHCFDWIAGTSTGGILALALASGKSLRECQRLYFRMKEFAFVGMRPYPSEALETILKECLGTETVMADIEHPKLMILAVLADRKPVDLHLFRNYKSAQEILDEHNGTQCPRAEAGDQASVVSLSSPPPPAEQLVWQAARATGAAPSYFRASGRYLDGGLMGNNPTLDVLTELTELNLALRATGQHEEAKKTNLKVVVSCGTGLIPVTKLNDIDVFKPESLWDTARLAWGLSAIGGLLVDQATQSDGRVVERARAWCAGLGVPYYRFARQMCMCVCACRPRSRTGAWWSARGRGARGWACRTTGSRGRCVCVCVRAGHAVGRARGGARAGVVRGAGRAVLPVREADVYVCVCVQATQSDGRVVERARAWCAGLGVPYYRFARQMCMCVCACRPRSRTGAWWSARGRGARGWACRTTGSRGRCVCVCVRAGHAVGRARGGARAGVVLGAGRAVLPVREADVYVCVCVQATQSDGRVVERARAWCAGLGVPYYRFARQMCMCVCACRPRSRTGAWWSARGRGARGWACRTTGSRGRCVCVCVRAGHAVGRARGGARAGVVRGAGRAVLPVREADVYVCVCVQATQSDGRVVERARAWCAGLGVPYYRFARQMCMCVCACRPRSRTGAWWSARGRGARGWACRTTGSRGRCVCVCVRAGHAVGRARGGARAGVVRGAGRAVLPVREADVYVCVCVQATQSDGRVVERARAWCAGLGVPYYRFARQMCMCVCACRPRSRTGAWWSARGRGARGWACRTTGSRGRCVCVCVRAGHAVGRARGGARAGVVRGAGRAVLPVREADVYVCVCVQATQSDGRVVERARAWCAGLGVPYYRFARQMCMCVCACRPRSRTGAWWSARGRGARGWACRTTGSRGRCVCVCVRAGHAVGRARGGARAGVVRGAGRAVLPVREADVYVCVCVQATQSDGRVVERARAWCAGLGVPYYRFARQMCMCVCACRPRSRTGAWWSARGRGARGWACRTTGSRGRCVCVCVRAGHAVGRARGGARAGVVRGAGRAVLPVREADVYVCVCVQATQSDGRVVERARAWCAGLGVPYYRFARQMCMCVCACRPRSRTGAWWSARGRGARGWACRTTGSRRRCLATCPWTSAATTCWSPCCGRRTPTCTRSATRSRSSPRCSRTQRQPWQSNLQSQGAYSNHYIVSFA